MVDWARHRLLTLAAERRVSLSELSGLIGRNVSYLHGHIHRASPRRLAEGDRATLARFVGVDPRELGAPESAPALVAGPYLAVAASAGPGRAAGEEALVRTELFAPAMLREAGVTPGQASLIDAAGDSMAPTILPVDRLLVDRATCVPGASPAIFVLRDADDALAVKRLHVEGSSIVVASDNPNYPVRLMPRRATSVIGRVRLVLRRT